MASLSLLSAALVTMMVPGRYGAAAREGMGPTEPIPVDRARSPRLRLRPLAEPLQPETQPSSLSRMAAAMEQGVGGP